MYRHLRSFSCTNNFSFHGHYHPWLEGWWYGLYLVQSQCNDSHSKNTVFIKHSPYIDRNKISWHYWPSRSGQRAAVTLWNHLFVVLLRAGHALVHCAPMAPSWSYSDASTQWTGMCLGQRWDGMCHRKRRKSGTTNYSWRTLDWEERCIEWQWPYLLWPFSASRNLTKYR